MSSGKREGFSDNKQGYGPSWFDVRDLWAWVETTYDIVLDLRIDLTHSISKQRGLRCVFLARSTGACLGVAGFGPAYPGGPKTLPAALLNCIYEVEKSIDRRLAIGLPADHPELFDRLSDRTA